MELIYVLDVVVASRQRVEEIGFEVLIALASHDV